MQYNVVECLDLQSLQMQSKSQFLFFIDFQNEIEVDFKKHIPLVDSINNWKHCLGGIQVWLIKSPKGAPHGIQG